MSRPYRLLAILFVAGYLLTLVAQAPASLLLGQVRPLLSEQPVELIGSEGTVWNGRTRINYQKQPLGILSWDFQPLSLLLFTPSVAWQLQLPDGEARGTLSTSGQQFTLSDTSVQGPLSLADRWLPMPASQFVEGRLQLLVDSATVQQEGISQLAGRFTLSQSRLLFGQPATLGTITGSLQNSPDGGVSAILDGTQGPLHQRGSVEVNPNGRFSIDIQLIPSSSAGNPLRQLLSNLGRPSADGSYPVKLNGNIRDYLGML